MSLALFDTLASFTSFVIIQHFKILQILKTLNSSIRDLRITPYWWLLLLYCVPAITIISIKQQLLYTKERNKKSCRKNYGNFNEKTLCEWFVFFFFIFFLFLGGAEKEVNMIFEEKMTFKRLTRKRSSKKPDLCKT